MTIDRNDKVVDEPLEHGQYRSTCWHFTSEVRGHPVFSGCTNGKQAVELLDEYIDWSRLPDHDMWGAEGAHPRDEVMHVWDFQVEHGIPPLYVAVPPEDVLEFAERYPLAHSSEGPLYVKTVSICFWYAQLMRQNGWFFLSSRKLAEMLGCSQRAARIYLQRAVRDGLIEVVGNYAKGTRRAREYRWIGDVRYL